MLNVNNISSGYGKKQILYDVSLDVNPGDVILLTGGNGSGKTTLLKCIYNLLPLWSGSIAFEGQDTKDKKPSDMIRLGMVYIPQKDFYFENLTVIENLQIAGNMLPKEILNERIPEVLEQTGLEKFRKRKPFDLSGGERKVLALGMALVHQPKLLLFDEPLAGVDNRNTDMILDLLFDINKKLGTALLIIEHRQKIKKGKTLKLNMGKL